MWQVFYCECKFVWFTPNFFFHVRLKDKVINFLFLELTFFSEALNFHYHYTHVSVFFFFFFPPLWGQSSRTYLDFFHRDLTCRLLGNVFTMLAIIDQILIGRYMSEPLKLQLLLEATIGSFLLFASSLKLLRDFCECSPKKKISFFSLAFYFSWFMLGRQQQS